MNLGKLLKITVVVAVTVLLVTQNVVVYFAYQKMSRFSLETLAQQMSNEADIKARLALHHGDLILFEIVSPESKLREPRQDGIYTIHEVIVGAFYDENYYRTYNATVGKIVDDPESPDWQIYLAVKAAKERGEWFEAKQPDVKEEPQETKASLPPVLRRMSAEEAFGPRPVEKPRQSRPLTTEQQAFGPAPTEKKN